MQTSSVRKLPLIIGAAIACALCAALVFVLLPGDDAGEFSRGETHTDTQMQDFAGDSPASNESGGFDLTEDGDTALAKSEERVRFNEAPSANVDLVAARKAMPDNLYWKHAAPTKDEKELAERVKLKRERNAQYGKVLSNTATVDEIHAYYAYKKRQSEDYVKFLQYLLQKHGDELSERDVGLYELGIELHTVRASEVPRQLNDALRRRAEYVKKKEAWLAGKGQ